MDRTALKLPFTIDRTPEWICPTCSKGVLRVERDSLKKQERRASRDHSHEAWEPEWIEYVYSCLLTCSNDACREVVSSAGTGRVVYNEYEDEHGEWAQAIEDLFKPKFFEPHLVLLTIPPKCPETIVKPLHDSFALYFSATGAALNSVRTAIEELLTELKVPRFNVVKRQRRFINLHQRIALLPQKYQGLQDILTAIKWLGNAGSHANKPPSADDVLNAYELLEHVLAEVYAPKAKHLEAIAKKVNKKKGPAK